MILTECKVMRMSVNGAATHYTVGMVIDHANQVFRGRIIESGGRLDDVLRGLRCHDEVKLRVWTELPVGPFGGGPEPTDNSKIKSLEYDGPAIVKMIRYRATRNALPGFSIAFTLFAGQRQ
jgi:hypothetical protein